MEEDPFSVKPRREDGKVTVSMDFFAEDKSEFTGPIYIFKSTSWIPFYEEANVTIIFPKGYESTEKTPSRPRVFEDGRWKYFALVREFNEFNLELEYTKSEIDGSMEKETSTPRFEDFSNNNKYEGEIAKPNFDTNKEAYAFRGQIKKDLEAGTNFAGHYTIAQWGCGTECSTGIVVDNKTGTIYSLPVAEFGREFRVKSNLLVVNPPDVVEGIFEGWQTPEWVSTRYFKWENNQFELIHAIEY